MELLRTERAIEILRYLRERPQGATLRELAEQTHCTKFEVEALLVHWRSKGAIERILSEDIAIYRLK